MDICYHPESGEILGDGRLLVPTSGIDQNGEECDGHEEVGPDHANYEVWRDMILHKHAIQTLMKDSWNKARELRRRR
jgi:hypothetical protein